MEIPKADAQLFRRRRSARRSSVSVPAVSSSRAQPQFTSQTPSLQTPQLPVASSFSNQQLPSQQVIAPQCYAAAQNYFQTPPVVTPVPAAGLIPPVNSPESGGSAAIDFGYPAYGYVDAVPFSTPVSDVVPDSQWQPPTTPIPEYSANSLPLTSPPLFSTAPSPAIIIDGGTAVAPSVTPDATVTIAPISPGESPPGGPSVESTSPPSVLQNDEAPPK